MVSALRFSDYYQALCMRVFSAVVLSVCLFQTKYAQNADKILSLLASYIEVTISNMNCATSLRSKLTVVIYSLNVRMISET